MGKMVFVFVLGLDIEVVFEFICAVGGYVVCVNWNSYVQMVIVGVSDSLDQVCDVLEKLGIKVI